MVRVYGYVLLALLGTSSLWASQEQSLSSPRSASQSSSASDLDEMPFLDLADEEGLEDPAVAPFVPAMEEPFFWFDKSIAIFGDKAWSWSKRQVNRTGHAQLLTLLDVTENRGGSVVVSLGLETFELSLEGQRTLLIPAGREVLFALDRGLSATFRDALFRIKSRSAPARVFAVGFQRAAEHQLRVVSLG